MSLLRQFIYEFRHRSLWQVLAIYLVASWVTFQVVQTVTEGLGLPKWFPALAALLLLVGLPIVMATALVQHGISRKRRHDPTLIPIDESELGRGSSQVEGPRRLLTWRNSLAGGLAALALWGVIAAGWLLFARDEPAGNGSPVKGALPAIAVLPFTVRGEVMEVWREGMVDALSTNLVGVAGLRTIASSTVLARWSEAVPDDRPADLATALAVAAAASANYAVLGRAIASGPNLRLDADLYAVETAEILDQARVEGSLDQVLRLIDQLSLEIVRTLGSGEAVALPKFDLAGVTTQSVDALKAYLEGEARFRRSDFESAIRSYGEAVAADSTFVLAYFRLADAYGYAGQFGAAQRADTRAQRALEEARSSGRWVVSDLPPTLFAGRYRGENPITLAERAVRERPQDAQRWFDLGEQYTHYGGRALAKPLSEREAFARAIELDSGLLTSYDHYIDSYFRLDPDSGTSRS